MATERGNHRLSSGEAKRVRLDKAGDKKSPSHLDTFNRLTEKLGVTSDFGEAAEISASLVFLMERLGKITGADRVRMLNELTKDPKVDLYLTQELGVDPVREVPITRLTQIRDKYAFRAPTAPRR